MEEIDKVYAEDLAVGDVVKVDTGDLEEVINVDEHGYAVFVTTENDGFMEYPFGSWVPIYGYKSVEV